jgi:hypothetical protein
MRENCTMSYDRVQPRWMNGVCKLNDEQSALYKGSSVYQYMASRTRNVVYWYAPMYTSIKG